MKRTHIGLLAMCLSLFMISMTTVSADTDYTTINGVTESQISVTGNLLPEESKPSEEIKEEEKTPEKPVEPKKEVSQGKQEEHLPKTGEINQSFHFLGLLIIGSTLLLFLRRTKSKYEI